MPRLQNLIEWITAKKLKDVLTTGNLQGWGQVRTRETIKKSGTTEERKNTEIGLAQDISIYSRTLLNKGKGAYTVQSPDNRFYPLLVRALRNNDEAANTQTNLKVNYENLMRDRPEIAVELLGSYLPELGGSVSHATAYNNRTSRLLPAVSALYSESTRSFEQARMEGLVDRLYSNFRNADVTALKSFFDSFVKLSFGKVVNNCPSGFDEALWHLFEHELKTKLKAKAKDDVGFLNLLGDSLDVKSTPPQAAHQVGAGSEPPPTSSLALLQQEFSKAPNTWSFESIKSWCKSIVTPADTSDLERLPQNTSKKEILANVINLLVNNNKLTQANLINMLNAALATWSNTDIAENASLLGVLSSKKVFELFRSKTELEQQPCFKKMVSVEMMDALFKAGRGQDCDYLMKTILGLDFRKPLPKTRKSNQVADARANPDAFDMNKWNAIPDDTVRGQLSAFQQKCKDYDFSVQYEKDYGATPLKRSDEFDSTKHERKGTFSARWDALSYGRPILTYTGLTFIGAGLSYLFNRVTGSKNGFSAPYDLSLPHKADRDQAFVTWFNGKYPTEDAKKSYDARWTVLKYNNSGSNFIWFMTLFNGEVGTPNGPQLPVISEQTPKSGTPIKGASRDTSRATTPRSTTSNRTKSQGAAYSPVPAYDKERYSSTSTIVAGGIGGNLRASSFDEGPLARTEVDRIMNAYNAGTTQEHKIAKLKSAILSCTDAQINQLVDEVGNANDDPLEGLKEKFNFAQDMIQALSLIGEEQSRGAKGTPDKSLKSPELNTQNAIAQVQSILDGTKNALAERGVRLEALQERTEDLRNVAQDFNVNARKLRQQVEQQRTWSWF